MATSDNVVRGGLTPKLKDANVLVEMLTYGTEEVIPMRGTSGHSQKIEVIYNSGFEEFNVVKIECRGDQVTFYSITLLDRRNQKYYCRLSCSRSIHSNMCEG